MHESPSLPIRVARLIGFGLLALIITAVAGGTWTSLLISNLRSAPAVPWSVPLMALLLWLIWSYLGGTGWPHSTSESRHRHLRANRSSLAVYSWALFTGVLSVIALAGLWIALFQLVPMEPNALPSTVGYPRFTIALMILMGSLVAPVAEEASFRGYFQVELESQFSPATAVAVSSLLFAMAHFTHGLYWPKLLVYFLVGIAFGTTACLTNSTLPAIAPHIVGDLTFFIWVWPYDATRKLIWQSGANRWFWIHVAQAIVFGAIAIWGFARLADIATRDAGAETAGMGTQRTVAL
jgi:membrane protease YdiL (CAAX protease family)